MNNAEVIEFEIERFIPVGHANAVSRKYLTTVTGLDDRQVRREISRSDAPIINLGYGYFIPDENDVTDRTEKAAYVAQERARIQTQIEKLHHKFRINEEEREA